MGKLATSKDLMFPQITVADQEMLIKVLCEKAVEKGFIEPQFCLDLLEREKKFPTGLDTPVPMAIPHVGTHCRKSFLSLATLKKPIQFEMMDGSEGEFPVKIVIVFGIVDPAEQVEVLKKFSCLFQNREFLEKLQQAPSADMMLAMLNEVLEDMLVVL